MNNDYNPPNKSALLGAIQKERANFESQLAGLSPSQKETKGVEAEWSIKDIMAHITAWERLAQDRLSAAITDEELMIPVIEGDDFVDVYNAHVYNTHKDMPLGEVENEFQASYLDFLAQIESLDDAFLSGKLPFDWAGDLTAQVLISANSHWHYLEHATSIEKWLSAHK